MSPSAVPVHVCLGSDPGVALIADLPDVRSGGKKKRVAGGCLTFDVDDGQQQSPCGSQHEDDEEDESDEFGGGDEPLNYFVGISNRTKEPDARVLEWDDSIDETAVNYLESESAASDIRTRNRQSFPEWFLLLHEKFNVILYGFGSKRNLLNNFSSTFLKDEHYLMINGYFPALTAKDVAHNLKEALEAESSDTDAILQAVDELDDTFYLVIHSIDVLFSTNSSKIKTLILDVVIRSQGSIRLIATADHVNCGLLFNSAEKAKMDLIWIHIPTFNPYTIERGYAGSGDAAAGDSEPTLSSVIHVYESLTPNAQKIFLQILDYYADQKKRSLEEKEQRKEETKLARQLLRDKKQSRKRKSKRRQQEVDEEEDECSDGDNERGSDERDEVGKTSKSRGRPADSSDNLPFAVLYRICREQYLVNSEITLKAQLIEFKDHSIMKMKKSSDGTPVVHLLISLELAQTFLNKIRDV